MNPKAFLEKVAHDWTPENLGVVKDVLLEAGKAVLNRSNIQEDPLLDTPNLPNLRGYLRWVIVARMLELAIDRKRLIGISANWVCLGGVHVFEMRGEFTSVTPCHLLSETVAPKDTEYRKDQRIVNAINPDLFQEFERESSEDDLLKILLAHGGKNTEFAYLRAYTDPSDNSVYRRLSSNIMLTQSIVPSFDEEFVAEPLVTLKKTAHVEKEQLITRRDLIQDLDFKNSRIKNESPAS